MCRMSLMRVTKLENGVCQSIHYNCEFSTAKTRYYNKISFASAQRALSVIRSSSLSGQYRFIIDEDRHEDVYFAYLFLVEIK